MQIASPNCWTATMFLPDINLWLALAFESHVHHAAALAWFESTPNARFRFCRMTQQGFLRLATNPKAVGAQSVTLADAWRMYDEFLADPRVSFSPEPLNVETRWRAYTQHQSFSPKVWNDAFLAAFAQTDGFELVTFDRGFAQYPDLRFIILS
jgi:toxin-antitoxin system PIN domain toxin